MGDLPWRGLPEGDDRGWSPREIFLEIVKRVGVEGWNIREDSLKEVSGPGASGRPLHYQHQPASRRQRWNALLSRGGAGESLRCLLVQGLS